MNGVEMQNVKDAKNKKKVKNIQMSSYTQLCEANPTLIYENCIHYRTR